MRNEGMFIIFQFLFFLNISSSLLYISFLLILQFPLSIAVTQLRFVNIRTITNVFLRICGAVLNFLIARMKVDGC